MPKKTEPAGVGHNSGDTSASVDVLNTTAQGQLRSFTGRLTRLADEEADVKEDIKEVFAEAKGMGFDVKVLREVMKRLREDRAKRQEFEALIDLYMSAIRDEVLS